MKWPAPISSPSLHIHLARSGHRVIRHHCDERIQIRIAGGNPIQACLGEIDRRDSSPSQQLGRFRQGQAGQIVRLGKRLQHCRTNQRTGGGYQEGSAVDSAIRHTRRILPETDAGDLSELRQVGLPIC